MTEEQTITAAEESPEAAFLPEESTTIRFSPSLLSFYPFEIEYPNLPEDLVVVGIEEYHAAMSRQPGETISYVDGHIVISPAPPPPPMTAEQAQTEKTARIAHATTMIDPLQDMVELGEATPEEEAALLAWKRYRIALTRITSTTPGWPSNIQWPEAPQ